MKYIVQLMCLYLALSSPLQAQNSPQLDPGFLPTQVYRPASADGALQLSDGSRVVSGSFSRAEGQATGGRRSLVRYLPGGAPDQAFNATLAAGSFDIMTMAEAANGKLLLGLYDAATFGGQRRAGLVQLNADGSLDPAFASWTPALSNSVLTILVQPDGKIVIGGDLSFLGLSPTPSLARLNADGSLDTGFQPALTAGTLNGVRSVVRQPDGKLLLLGLVVPAGSQTGQVRLLRLEANGTQDATFQATLNPAASPAAVAVQPDGKVLVVSDETRPILPGGSSPLARLSATGTPDATFQPSGGLQLPGFPDFPSLLVQPDGKILVTNVSGGVAGQVPVARLLPSGAFDASWNVPHAPGDFFPRAESLQLLPGGQVLVAGYLLRLGAVAVQDRAGAVLSPTGQPLAGFDPQLLVRGSIRDVVQQPDGKLVAVGQFSEVNGVAALNIVRFDPDGSVDAAFSRQASITGGVPVRVLAQPDGTLLVGGGFAAAGGAARAGLARLLPTGQVDAAYLPPFPAPGLTRGGSSVQVMARQPDGRLLVAGSLERTGQALAAFLRLDAAGAVDPAFNPGNLAPGVLLVQPDGRILAGINSPTAPLRRLLPNGAPDASFTATFANTSGPPSITALARYPDGRLLVAGRFTQVGPVNTTLIARLQPNGLADASFASQGFQLTGHINSLAIQPNERILLTGQYQGFPLPAGPSLHRLLATGAFDVTFNSALGPGLGAARVLVQPDGAIVAAGGFETVAGLPVMGITRLLAAEVLGTRRSAVAGRVQAWPVPAHDALHLTLDAAARPRHVQLRNTLGQVVLTQVPTSAAPTLRTSGLAPGVYLLQVEYADAAPVTLRVVLN